MERAGRKKRERLTTPFFGWCFPRITGERETLTTEIDEAVRCSA
jgi:hypothetical protein